MPAAESAAVKRLIVIAAALAVMGVPAYLWVAGSIFGVSAKHPLGRFDLIDGWLVDKGFTKSKGEGGGGSERGSGGGRGGERGSDAKQRLGDLFGAELEDAEILTYEHEYKDHITGGRTSRVIVLRSRDGDVRGIAAMFMSGREEMRDPTCRGEAMLGTLWLEITGTKPAFEERMRGKGRFARMERVATLRQGRAQGTWRKRYETNGDARTISDVVTLAVK